MQNSDVIFIVTKPLQIMVSMTIRDNLSSSINAHLFLVNSFIGSYEVFSRLKVHDDRWFAFKIFNDTTTAIRACAAIRPKNVFIASDVGSRTYIMLISMKLRSLHTRISVYEEGIGTYFSDLYPFSIRSNLVRLIGAGTYFGGCVLTNDVWVYDRMAYVRQFPHTRSSVYTIDPPLTNFITNNFKLLENVFCPQTMRNFIPTTNAEDDCIVYLPTWIIDYSFVDCSVVERIKSMKGIKYIKFHPHVRINDNKFLTLFDVEVPPSIPAELLIFELSRKFSRIYVFHHNSSVAKYLELAKNNVTFIDMLYPKVAS